MPTYYRRDDWVTDALGNAISGAQVYVCSQPANTTSIPPSPEVQLYADPNGVTPLTQPVLTDGYGHAFYYTLPAIYTVVYYSPQIQQVTLLDQDIASGNGISLPVSIPDGGTDATTAPQALVNLGAAARGANVDITSLGDIPNTTINSTGYVFGSNFNTGTAGITAANQTFSGTPYSGYGVGVTSTGGAAVSVLGAGFIGTSGEVSCNTLACNNNVTASLVAANTIQGFTANSPLILTGPTGTNTDPANVLVSAQQTSPISGVGLFGFTGNYYTQTAAPSAGGAGALPATPAGYIQMLVNGTIRLFPYY